MKVLPSAPNKATAHGSTAALRLSEPVHPDAAHRFGTALLVGSSVWAAAFLCGRVLRAVLCDGCLTSLPAVRNDAGCLPLEL